MTQYYLLRDTLTHTNSYWKGDSSQAGFLTTLGKMVLPLGNRKPKNVPKEEIKTFLIERTD